MNCYETVNIVISILGFAGLCIEIYLLIKEQKNHLKELKIQEAINLSDKFKDLISNNLSFILETLENDEYERVINEISENELKYFNENEFEEIVKKHPKLELYRYLEDYMCIKNLKCVSESYISHYDVDIDDFAAIRYFENKDWKLTKQEEKTIKSKSKSKAKDQNRISEMYIRMVYYRNKIANKYSISFTDCLNELEELCMALNKGIVDEDTVYQSLHQIVIRSIKYFYPVICLANKHNNSYDKYYTHTINLYNKWVDRRNNEMINEKDKNNIVHKSIL